jgi:HPt (histidine-containing phosphotransfer) domain-containing protein
MEKNEAQRMRSDALIDSEILIAWGANRDGMIQWSSPAWRRFTGVSLAQQIRHRWQTHVHPEDESAFENDGRNTLHARKFRLRHHDGTFHFVLGYRHSSLDQTGSVTGHHAACFEIVAATAPMQEVETPLQDLARDSSIEFDQPIKFDHQAIRELFDHDQQSLLEVAQLFDKTCEESLTFLASGFGTFNQQALFATAHRLKGAVANMNAPQVLESCQQLETAIRENKIAEAQRISQNVIRSVAQLRDLVQKEFQS